MFPVAEGEYGGLFAEHAFFYDDSRPGIAENVVDQGLPDRCNGFIDRLCDGYALSGCQPVGLDDDGYALLAYVGFCVSGVVEFGVGGGGDVVALHHFFGEGFARFQLRRLGAWSESFNPGLLEAINYAVRQRIFRADNYEIDFVVFGEVEEGIVFVRVNGDAFGEGRHT